MSLDNVRLFDLVRYQRQELYQAGLINEDEYTELMTTNPGAVKRLESYDVMKTRIAELEASVRNQQGDNLCWFDLATMQIPPQGDFLESCRRYHAQIAQTNGVLEGSRTIAQLEARVAELEAERDALKQKVAHLDKLADLYPISLGNACEERDKLKHSDRALRKENAVLREALEILVKRQCGSFCTERDKDGNERYKEIAARCATCVAKEALSRIPEANNG